MGCENEFQIRKNDTLPVLRALLVDADGNVPDLTGVTGRFVMIDSAGTVVVDAAATFNEPPATDELTAEKYNAEYAWAAVDTNRDPGSFRAEFEVTFPGGGIATFPSDPDEMIRVVIRKEHA